MTPRALRPWSIAISRAAGRQGKLANLEAQAWPKTPVPGSVGIGHTRWATHGEPTETNAHPHMTENVAVVHNGIIENFRELRDELIAAGRNFQSDTDTEVVPQMITYLMQQGRTVREAIAEALPRLRGAFALGILIAGEERHQSLARGAEARLPIGWGEGEMFLASDALGVGALYPTRDLSGRRRLGRDHP